MTILTFLDDSTDIDLLFPLNPEVILSKHFSRFSEYKLKVTNDPVAVENFEKIVGRFLNNKSLERFTALEYGNENPYIYYSFNLTKKNCINIIVEFLKKSNWIKTIGGLTQSESSDTNLNNKVISYF